jgi:glycosyltransferase involved in cell wall biosynthesis
MTKILRCSKFEPLLHGHGGHRRTAQITELLHTANLEIQEIEHISSTPVQRYLFGLQFLAKYRPRCHLSRPTISGCGQQYLNCLRAVEHYSGHKIMLWEMTFSYVPLYVAKNLGFRLIALPHNLESFVPDFIDPLTGKSLPSSFENEINHLAQADRIFCISREEQWLLKLRGVAADYLPYYPPQPILENLAFIREQRQTSEKQRFLILGTAKNPPTLAGMEEQLQWLEQLCFDAPVDVAGYGTEKLTGWGDRFNVLGSVEPEKLEHLLIHAKAILVHQRAGVGALTRIPEMLIAGIPVIASSNACRSVFGTPGLYCYDSKSELQEWLNQELPLPPIFPRPAPAEQRFIEYLQQSVH